MSISNLIYKHVNKKHKFTESQGSGICATCCQDIHGMAVDKSEIQSETFGRASDFLRFGDYVCLSCAWMYSDVKITHRNVLACEDWCLWPMISHDTATEERPSWLDCLRLFSQQGGGTEAVGVLTIDPKIRLWPMTNMVTRDNFGMYIHVPGYNTSSFVSFSIDDCLNDCVPLIMEAMKLNFSKKSCYYGLENDFKGLSKNLHEGIKIEKELAKLRSGNAFLPALMISGQRKDGQTLPIKFPEKEQNNTITKTSHQAQGSLF